MKPMLNAPGTQRLRLTCDELLSSFAFKFNLRRHTPVRRALLAVFALHGFPARPPTVSAPQVSGRPPRPPAQPDRIKNAKLHLLSQLVDHCKVGRCRLALSNPR